MRNKNQKIDPEFWRDIIVRNCKACGGKGILTKDDYEGSVELCRCSRMVRLFVKMNDPEHGLHPKYHKWTLNNAIDLLPSSKEMIKKYIKIIDSNLPYRNGLIVGEKNAGKSSVAAILYKELMTREYDVSVVRFSELASLSRMFISNTQGFNDRKEFYEMIKDEEFLIIEDIDSRGHSNSINFEKLGYSLLDDVFSYRANHPSRSTILTVDDGLNITESTLGHVFYYSIYTSDIEDNKLFRIPVKTSKHN